MILLLLITLSPAAFANTDAQIVRGLQEINKNRWSSGKNSIARAKDPLGSKLYYWLEFTQKSESSNYAALAQFIRRNPDWPLRSKLLRRAEEAMPMTLSNVEVMTWFNDFPPKTADGLDRYMAALLQSGRSAQARKMLSDWWASNSMSRDQQRRLFRKYKNYLTRDAHKRRFDRELLNGSHANARAIASVLKQGYPQLAEARIALSKEEKNVNGLINAVPGRLQNDPGLLYERLRWRRRSDLDTGAMEILHKMPKNNVSNPAAWWRERHILIRRLLEKKHYKSAYLLASTHKQKEGFAYAQAEWLAGWMALRFMNKPVDAYKRFSNLYRNVKTPISKARASYWAGRAAETFSDKSLSQTSYDIATRFPTVFYGQLALAKTGKVGTLPAGAPPRLNAQETAAFSKEELIRAADLLRKASMTKEAKWFLKAFTRKHDTAKGFRFAADTAVEWGMLNAAVEISKSATQNGLFLTAQSYPLLVNKMRNVPVEWSLVHGIIRQESQFDIDAKSPVGALGLMQLMPATAKETARKLGIRHSTSRLTSDPGHNIRLGSAYLERMIKRFDGAYPMAAAAYNAGPGRVDRWIKTFGDPRRGEVDWIDWMELVPIYETRNYIQRVLEATYVYRLRLKSVQPPPKAVLHTDFR